MKTEVKKYLKITPDDAVKRFRRSDFWQKKKNTAKRVGIVAVLTSVFNYFYFIVNGYGGPDAVCEGVWYYIGENTATSSARWFIPYINMIFGQNLIIPLLIVAFYSLFIAIAAFFIFELWNIENVGFQILSVSAMVCFPVVTRQFAYLYTALAYAIAFLMVVLAAWLLRKRSIISFIVGTVCLVLMYGSFQSYIGAAATIVMISFLIDMIYKRSVLESLKDVGIYIISGIVAGGLDLLIANIMMNVRNLEASERVGSVSLTDIIEYLDFSIPASYRWFFMYFKLNVLLRDKLYITLFCIIIVLVLANMVTLMKKKKIIQGILLIISVLLLPMAMNVCAIIFPHNGIYDVMRYQYVLIIPLAFGLFQNLSKNMLNVFLQWLTYLTVFLLIFGFTITSNASSICYKLVYESTHDQALNMLSVYCIIKLYQIAIENCNT